MEIEFDSAKDATNVDKHGVSLACFVDMEIAAIVEDDRFDEPRLRAYGLINGEWHCAALVVRTGYRVISLRRAHRKEIKRYV